MEYTLTAQFGSLHSLGREKDEKKLHRERWGKTGRDYTGRNEREQRGTEKLYTGRDGERLHREGRG